MREEKEQQVAKKWGGEGKGTPATKTAIGSFLRLLAAAKF